MMLNTVNHKLYSDTVDMESLVIINHKCDSDDILQAIALLCFCMHILPAEPYLWTWSSQMMICNCSHLFTSDFDRKY